MLATTSPQAVIPFTPVEEVLTPPPDIDTSGWLTYRDDANGFELKYPPDAQLKQDVKRSGPGPIGIGTEIDLTFASGTALREKYILSTVADLTPKDCVPSKRNSMKPGAAPRVALVYAGGAAFWRTEELGSMMSNFVHMWVYMTSIDKKCVTINAVLYGDNPRSFPTPPSMPDIERESEVFAAILSTFRWTN